MFGLFAALKSVKNCYSAVSCCHFKSQHHSLLHFPEPSIQVDIISDESEQSIEAPDSSSRVTEALFPKDALLPRITGHLPSAPVDPQAWSHLAYLQLANPDFEIPGAIYMLLGAEFFPYRLKGSKREGLPSTPVALDVYFH
ncbi:hypothetical protein PR048_001004 [Dryococelus australis]|uniref:Uncharacterized protein n=1 Tax=Dryococelus australis TaxID=614101 RepID=A0ABQ9IG57_9NEOP|nr:hypothetical protein PR048_001004 [Dryococelus australis]